MRECATTLSSEMREDELEFLLKVLVEHRFEGQHLEVGTAAGGTLWRMIKGVQSSGANAPFVVVDPMGYFPNQLDTVKENLRENGVDPASVDFRLLTSEEAVQKAKEREESFDFILIDGAHKIHRVTEDLQWTECLREGGVIAFHDYCPAHKGVLWSVNRFLRRHPNFRRVGQVNSLLVLRKEGSSSARAVRRRDRLFARLWAPLLNLEISIQKRLKRRLFLFRK